MNLVSFLLALALIIYNIQSNSSAMIAQSSHTQNQTDDPEQPGSLASSLALNTDAEEPGNQAFDASWKLKNDYDCLQTALQEHCSTITALNKKERVDSNTGCEQLLAWATTEELLQICHTILTREKKTTVQTQFFEAMRALKNSYLTEEQQDVYKAIITMLEPCYSQAKFVG